MTSPVQTEPAKPRKPAFRSWSDRPKLGKDEAKRQGAITQLAFALLGGREGAIAFLNADNAALGSRPLDLAIASDAGYASVEQAIRELSAK